MNKASVLAYAVLCCTLLTVPPLHAQEWSDAQEEVWKNVEAYWARDAAGDLDGFMSYFHENYIGWGINDPLPAGKAATRKYLAYAYGTEKTIFYDIQPVAINVVGNVAIVDYYYSSVIKDAEGKNKEISGR